MSEKAPEFPFMPKEYPELKTRKSKNSLENPKKILKEKKELLNVAITRPKKGGPLCIAPFNNEADLEKIREKDTIVSIHEKVTIKSMMNLLDKRNTNKNFSPE